MNRKLILLAISLLITSACTIVLSGEKGNKASLGPSQKDKVTLHVERATAYNLVDHHWSDVAKIRSEAERLSYKVKSGEIDKVSAAKELDQFRLDLVGHNIVDDSVYRTYLNAAIDSSQGVITGAQSKALIKSTLEGWQARWKKMDNSAKPDNPAFSNFLNEIFSLPYLQ